MSSCGDFEALLARSRAGEEAAVTALYRGYQPRLHRFVSTVLPGHADDVCSETWIQVVRSLERFSGDEPGFVAWLFTIARNKVVDLLRYEGRRPTSLLSDEAADIPDECAFDPAEAAVDQEATGRAVALIRTLPPDQAEVVFLRTVVGLDNHRVAEIVGKSPGAVRILAHRGLRRLARTVALEAPAAV